MRDELKLRNWLLAKGYELVVDEDLGEHYSHPETGCLIPAECINRDLYRELREHPESAWLQTIRGVRGGRPQPSKPCGCQGSQSGLQRFVEGLQEGSGATP